jgi:hypothetical protein
MARSRGLGDVYKRQCQYCKIDRGSLQEQRFYDKDALTNTMPCDRKYHYDSGGTLNSFLFCGGEACFRKAMLLRKNEIINGQNP